MPHIYVIGPRDKVPFGARSIDVTSRSTTIGKKFSPFFLGPVWIPIRDEFVKCQNVENAWQFSKVYPQHVDADGNIDFDKWLKWARVGWNDRVAHRYPMGKGAIPKFSYWNGEQLNYIDARKKIYDPIYRNSARTSEHFVDLKEYVRDFLFRGIDVALWDFDGYNADVYGMGYEEIINDPTKKMGHAFVLRELLNETLGLEG